MPKKFVRYISVESGEYLNENVGRCNREDSCGYHYTPKQYFSENGITAGPLYKRTQSRNGSYNHPSFSRVDKDLFSRTLTNYSVNNLVNYLTKIFDQHTLDEILKKYNIGTSKKWPGASIFWQIDEGNNVRTGKIMLYSSQTGKRIREPYNHISWVHKSIIGSYILKQCFFGEHLIKIEGKPIAIVESEKTAIIASAYLPQFTWIATGGKNGCCWTDPAVYRALKGYKVTLFPDLGAFEFWNSKASVLRHAGIELQISSLLENKASRHDKIQGFDIADYLVKHDLKTFKRLVGKFHQLEEKKPYRSQDKVSDLRMMKQVDTVTVDLNGLKNRIAALPIHKGPIRLNSGEMVLDTSKFILSHLAALEQYYNSPIGLVYAKRLLRLLDILENVPSP